MSGPHTRALSRTIRYPIGLAAGETQGMCECGFNQFHVMLRAANNRLSRLVCSCCGASQGLPFRPAPSGPVESGEAKARRGGA